MNTNSKRQSKPLRENREGKWCGKVLAALRKLFRCAPAQQCLSGGAGLQAFQIYAKHECKFWHFIVLQEIQPRCVAASEGPELHGALPVSLHMALGDEL